jgi:hypothetical protein
MGLLRLAENGKMLRIFEEVVGLELLLNLMDDLVALMVWPDQRQYLSKHFLRMVAYEMDALPKRSRSSANSKW